MESRKCKTQLPVPITQKIKPCWQENPNYLFLNYIFIPWLFCCGSKYVEVNTSSNWQSFSLFIAHWPACLIHTLHHTFINLATIEGMISHASKVMINIWSFFLHCVASKSETTTFWLIEISHSVIPRRHAPSVCLNLFIYQFYCVFRLQHSLLFFNMHVHIQPCSEIIHKYKRR